jgi:hypothetical protein
MELIHLNIIKNSENVELKVNSLKYENKFLINKKLCYLYIFDNYIYYREDLTNVDVLDDQVTKRLKILTPLNIEYDNEFILNFGIASHNFRLFNLNNNIYGIGGQSLGIANYTDKLVNTKNQKYINYHNNDINKFLNSSDYGVNHLAGDKIYNPSIVCPYYANGLHLFSFDNFNLNAKSFNVENNGLPIVSGIMNNRHDGHYGYSDNYNIDKSKNGLTVFDSQTSVLYNNQQNKYYLYQRANIGIGIRYIQYTTSNDLINWSEFNLLKINPEINYFKFNFYYSNFFKINGVNNFIGILPSNQKIADNYYGLDTIQNYRLYYSNNCIEWNYIGIINSDEYHKNWLTVGTPILYDNKYYFYISNDENLSLEIYSMEKNRFSYLTYNQKDIISKIEFKLMNFEEKNIKINIKIEENGYIKVQLKDENNKIIEGYSFNDFDIMGENISEFEYKLSWNNNSMINNDKIYIEIEGVNFNIYSINCSLVYI